MGIIEAVITEEREVRRQLNIKRFTQLKPLQIQIPMLVHIGNHGVNAYFLLGIGHNMACKIDIVNCVSNCV
jgi:hypothetical protein